MSGILVDTSVWIDHFRYRNEALVELLKEDRVLMHRLVLVEIACGTRPAPGTKPLGYLRSLRPSHAARAEETMQLIESKRCYGSGRGAVDLMLLASTLITPANFLWTFDVPLRALAKRLRIAYDKPHQARPERR